MLLALGFALALYTPLRAAGVTATATADRPAVRLSEVVRVTLAVDGPTPVRVELTPGLLDDPSAVAWRVRPDGPPTVVELPSGRQRWAAVFRADPYRPGEPLRLAFAPARVTAGADARPADVPFPPLDVTVTTEVTDPSGATVRPITGIEELPAVEVPSSGRSMWPWLAAAGAGLLVAAWLAWRRRSASPLPPEEEARRGLADASAALARGDDPSEVADRVAAAVRRFLARRYGLPAEARTTAELLAAGDWPDDGAELRAVLDACDRAKFAPDLVGDAVGLIQRASELLPRLAPSPGGPA